MPATSANQLITLARSLGLRYLDAQPDVPDVEKARPLALRLASIMQKTGIIHLTMKVERPYKALVVEYFCGLARGDLRVEGVRSGQSSHFYPDEDEPT